MAERVAWVDASSGASGDLLDRIRHYAGRYADVHQRAEEKGAVEPERTRIPAEPVAATDG